MASPRSNGGMSEPQASAAEAEQEAVPQVLFRAGKKRKAYRQREHDNGDGVAVVVDDHSDRATSEQLVSPLVDVHSATRQATISPVAPGCTPSRRNSDDGGRRKDEESADDDEENEEEAGLSVAELLRRRNARRAAARLRGVEFRPDSAGGVTSALSPTSGDDDGGRTLVVPPGGSEELRSPGLVAVDGSGPGGIPLAKQFAHQTGMVSQVVNKHM